MNLPISETTAPEATAQILALSELENGHTQHSAKAIASINPLLQIKARLQVCVGEAELTVGELLAAQENQVIALNRGVEQPVDLLLEGQVVARGQLVALEENFAIRITELPIPLKA